MNKNSNGLFDRVEIYFYSLLISFISWVNRIRVQTNPGESFPDQSPSYELIASKITSETPSTSINQNRINFRQILIPLLIWTILGFAAGFMIGMINPG